MRKFEIGTFVRWTLLLLLFSCSTRLVKALIGTSSPWSSFASASSSSRRHQPLISSFLLRVSSPSSSAGDTASSFTATIMSSINDNKQAYSEADLRIALNSLLEGSKDPNFDARHILGYNNELHSLSKLQRITATRILDYQSSTIHGDSIDELLTKAQDFGQQHGPIRNLQTVIQDESPRMALAAEFKRASPSKGAIAPNLKAGEQAVKYFQAGANIISILTEEKGFQGSLQDLTDARLETTQRAMATSKQRPAILRKDFIVNRYMIAEAAAAGADTVLLIVAVLPQHLLNDLINYCRRLNMEPLVEVHADSELDVALQAGARVIGVNNRNLHTFQMDLETSERVARRMKDQNLDFDHNDTTNKNKIYTLCALSGMSSALDVDRYRKVGLGMVLIGESLMRAANPEAAIQSLCLHPDDYTLQQEQLLQGTATGAGAYTMGTQLIKVCGITNANDATVACQAGANLIGVIFATKSKRLVTTKEAQQVVQAVQAFGERTSRVNLAKDEQNDNKNAMSSLVKSSRMLVAASKRPLVVGVFQNQPSEYIREIVEECGLDLVQLHGSEGMQAASVENCGCPAIRVVDICLDSETGSSQGATEAILGAITADPVAILLDTAIKGQENGGGGTGQAFDWTIAQRMQDHGLPVIIAGGLTPETVTDCVTRIRPFGVDVSSGVEVSPREKDHDKVRLFVRGARHAAEEAMKGF